jgi:hypothetical protein
MFLKNLRCHFHLYQQPGMPDSDHNRPQTTIYYIWYHILPTSKEISEMIQDTKEPEPCFDT